MGTYQTFAAGQRLALERLMAASDSHFGPLFSEPLRWNLLLSDIFSDAREELYSGGLGWCLGLLSLEKALHILGIHELPANMAKVSKKEWSYDTEVAVPEGHEGQEGRIDLVISHEQIVLAAIEVKTRDYTEFDTKKHRGYTKWIDSCGGFTKPAQIFIAIRDLNIELHGFRFLSWADVTAGLRRHAPAVIKDLPYPQGAMYLAFIAAVEENLLRFGPPETLTPGMAVRQANHLRAVTDNSMKDDGVILPMKIKTSTEELQFVAKTIPDYFEMAAAIDSFQNSVLRILREVADEAKSELETLGLSFDDAKDVSKLLPGTWIQRKIVQKHFEAGLCVQWYKEETGPNGERLCVYWWIWLKNPALRNICAEIRRFTSKPCVPEIEGQSTAYVSLYMPLEKGNELKAYASRCTTEFIRVMNKCRRLSQQK